MMRQVILLLVLAAASPAFGRVLMGEIDAQGEMLTCMTSVVKVSGTKCVKGGLHGLPASPPLPFRCLQQSL
jgi:hypothetical protein